jgi:selenocysteine-specific elongation factor
VIQVTPEVVFSSEGYERMLSDVKQMLQTEGAITAALVRDRFNTSRRYVLAFLEHLDSRGITVREGDVRRLRQ